MFFFSVWDDQWPCINRYCSWLFFITFNIFDRRCPYDVNINVHQAGTCYFPKSNTSNGVLVIYITSTFPSSQFISDHKKLGQRQTFVVVKIRKKKSTDTFIHNQLEWIRKTCTQNKSRFGSYQYGEKFKSTHLFATQPHSIHRH